VRDCTVTIDVLVGCDRLARILLGPVKAIAQDKTQDRLRRAPGKLCKALNAPTLRGSNSVLNCTEF
jgi:hypothetical protein